MTTISRQRTTPRRIFQRSTLVQGCASRTRHVTFYSHPAIPVTAQQLQKLMQSTTTATAAAAEAGKQSLFQAEENNSDFDKKGGRKIDNRSSITAKVHDFHVIPEGNAAVRKEIRFTAREAKMSGIQYTLQGYNTASPIHKAVNKRKNTYFSSPYKCINDCVGKVTTSYQEQLSNEIRDKTTRREFEPHKDTACTIVMNKQGVKYRTMPSKLITLPPIEDLKSLKRPIIRVKVTVKKKQGKFKPTAVIDEGQQQSQQLTETKYRLAKLDNIPTPIPKCHKVMVPKALKHPAKMRAVHIPYHRNTYTKHLGRAGSDSNVPLSEEKSLNSPHNANRKMVRFAPDTFGISRGKYVKTPTPKRDLGDEDNLNFSNNNGDTCFHIQLPKIKERTETTGNKAHNTSNPVVALPTVGQIKYSLSDLPVGSYQQVITSRKGTITGITPLSPCAELRKTKTSHNSRRSMSQGHKVKPTEVILPPTWQDHEEFQDYLKQKYPHILNAIQNNPTLLDMEKSAANYSSLKAYQKMIQHFYRKPAQTNETPICPPRHHHEDHEFT